MPLPPHLSPDSTNPTYIWRNGDVVPWHEATVHVNAVGHASVSAVFEGLKAYWNVDREQLYVFRLREHMQRLIESLKIVQLGNRFSLDEMVDGVLTILRANECRRDMYVRSWVFAEGIIREQLLPPGAPTEMVIDMWGFATKMLTDRGVTAGVSSWTRIDDNSMPARAKAFSNYHNGRLAIAEARAKAYDWPILLTDRRKVSEGAASCVALVRCGAIVMPTIASGVLESITRATFMVLARELEIPFVEREVDRTELYVADEVFFMGTGWEILPVVTVDGIQVGDGVMGPVAKALDRGYHDVVRGVTEAHAEWRTPVWER